MKLPRRRFLKLAVGAAALPAVSRLASAQAYPSKPITIVVPYAAGGPTDTIGRVLAERMRSSLGQTVIIENTTGAGGTIAVGRVARAAPDGYTIGIGQWTSHVGGSAMYNLPFDVHTDLQPLSVEAERDGRRFFGRWARCCARASSVGTDESEFTRLHQLAALSRTPNLLPSKGHAWC